MVGFLNRLFGGVDNGAPNNVAEGLNNKPGRREVGIENKNLKLRKLYQAVYEAIEDNIGRELERHEKHLVDHSIDETLDEISEKQKFDDLSGEGLLVYARKIAKTLGLDDKKFDSWTPGQDRFTPMETHDGGNARQVNFERGLMDYLGRPPSDQELAQARAAFLRAGDDEWAKFNTMVGEEVNAYARKLAKGLEWEPAGSTSEKSGVEIAAAAK